MADKEDKAFAATFDPDKELPAPLSNDDFVLPLLVLTIMYGPIFSISAVFRNAISPQLWTPSPAMTQVQLPFSFSSKFAGDILTLPKVMAYFTSRLEDHIDITLLTSHPLNIPGIIYCLPALIYVTLVILVFWLLKPWNGTGRKPTTYSWSPALCVFPALGVGALMGLSFWEEVFVTLPLTMSLSVLPWYFGLYKERLLEPTLPIQQ
jgi:hypothetical protein